jgi:hypothetical protein
VVVVVVAGTVVVVVVAGGDVGGGDAIVDGTVVDGSVVTAGTVVDDDGAVVADPAVGIPVGVAAGGALPVVRRAFGAVDAEVPVDDDGAGAKAGAAVGGGMVDDAVVDVRGVGGAERELTVA